MTTTAPRASARQWTDAALARARDRGRYPTWEELGRSVDALVERAGGRLVRERIGESGERRPLERLSIGCGRRSVLVVGGPHANEPLGGATIEALLTLLVDDPAFAAEVDCTWHVIPCIDPDGLERNRGWVEAPLSLESYAHHFFRPAFTDQAEYSFPLNVGGSAQRVAPPENLAWRRVLDEVRPQLQFSLHNAEIGGAFHIVTDTDPVLHAALTAATRDAAMELSPVGEAFGELEKLAEGVFLFPDVARLAEPASGFAWQAGDSSAGYARRHGTESVTTEISLWRCTARGAPRAMAELIEEHVNLATPLAAALRGSTQDVLRGDTLPIRWRNALEEALEAFDRQRHMLSRVLERTPTKPEGALPAALAVECASQLALSRQRVTAIAHGSAAACDNASTPLLRALLDESIATVKAIGGPEPFAPAQCVAAQLGSMMAVIEWHRRR